MLAIALMFDCNAIAADDSLNEELDYRVRFSKAADIKILLDKGADPNYINQLGLPMTVVAVTRKDTDALPVLKTLVEAGADFNQGGSSNQYPLLMAVKEENIAMLKYLLAKPNIQLNIFDLNGMTPLEIAEYKADDEMISLIRSVKDAQDKKAAELKNPMRRNQLMYKWVGLQCDKYYNEHYFKVKLDKKTPEEIRQVMDKYPPQFEQLKTDLNRNFNINTNNFAMYVANFVNPRLEEDFSQTMTNRMRRKKGFGTDADRNAKCEKIVKEFEKKLPNF